jgi:hypothetical protein
MLMSNQLAPTTADATAIKNMQLQQTKLNAQRRPTLPVQMYLAGSSPWPGDDVSTSLPEMPTFLIPPPR